MCVYARVRIRFDSAGACACAFMHGFCLSRVFMRRRCAVLSTFLGTRAVLGDFTIYKRPTGISLLLCSQPAAVVFLERTSMLLQCLLRSRCFTEIFRKFMHVFCIYKRYSNVILISNVCTNAKKCKYNKFGNLIVRKIMRRNQIGSIFK